MKQLKADIEGLQAQEDILRERKVDWDRLTRLRDAEIPALQMEAKTSEEEVETAESNRRKVRMTVMSYYAHMRI